MNEIPRSSPACSAWPSRSPAPSANGKTRPCVCGAGGRHPAPGPLLSEAWVDLAPHLSAQLLAGPGPAPGGAAGGGETIGCWVPRRGEERALQPQERDIPQLAGAECAFCSCELRAGCRGREVGRTCAVAITEEGAEEGLSQSGETGVWAGGSGSPCTKAGLCAASEGVAERRVEEGWPCVAPWNLAAWTQTSWL